MRVAHVESMECEDCGKEYRKRHVFEHNEYSIIFCRLDVVWHAICCP